MTAITTSNTHKSVLLSRRRLESVLGDDDDDDDNGQTDIVQVPKVLDTQVSSIPILVPGKRVSGLLDLTSTRTRWKLGKGSEQLSGKLS